MKQSTAPASTFVWISVLAVGAFIAYGMLTKNKKLDDKP